MADILVGALGLVGVLLLAAFLAGVLGGVLFFFARRLRARLHGEDVAPSISPSALPR